VSWNRDPRGNNRVREREGRVRLPVTVAYDRKIRSTMRETDATAPSNCVG
jgi:hypothetical protein